MGDSNKYLVNNMLCLGPSAPHLIFACALHRVRTMGDSNKYLVNNMMLCSGPLASRLIFACALHRGLHSGGQ